MDNEECKCQPTADGFLGGYALGNVADTGLTATKLWGHPTREFDDMSMK